jgi:hypothetical protein
MGYYAFLKKEIIIIQEATLEDLEADPGGIFKKCKYFNVCQRGVAGPGADPCGIGSGRCGICTFHDIRFY